MNTQKRYKTIIKNAAGAVLATIMLAAITAAPAVSAMPSATTHVLAHPPVSGDCASCHPKPTNPKRTH